MSGDRSYGFYFFGEEAELRKVLSNHWDSVLGFSIDKKNHDESEYELYDKFLAIRIFISKKIIEPDDFYDFINELKDVDVSICLFGGDTSKETIYFGSKNKTGKTFSNFFGLSFKEFHKYINLKLFGFSDLENEILLNHGELLGDPKESRKDLESEKLDLSNWINFVVNHTSSIGENDDWDEKGESITLEKDKWDG